MEWPQFLEHSTVLIDTIFFIDSFTSKNRKAYEVFIKDLKDKSVALVSPSLVKFEFIRSRTIDVVKEKEKHFYHFVDLVLPYDRRLEDLVLPAIEEYKQYMEGLPLTDLILATYLKRYVGLYLLTRDHADFPTSIFTREYIFNIKDFKEKIYAIYSYKPKVK